MRFCCLNVYPTFTGMKKSNKTTNTKKQGIKAKNENYVLKAKIRQSDKKIKLLNDFIRTYKKLK